MSGMVTLRDTIKAIVADYDNFPDQFQHRRLVPDRPNCFAEITYTDRDEDVVTGYGFSKVCYPDEWDEEKGLNIAISRALVSIGKRVYEKAYWANLIEGANRAEDLFDLDILEEFAAEWEAAREEER
jgi:hypothetical protein